LIARASDRLPRTAAAVRQVIASIDRQDIDEAYLGLLGLTSVLRDESQIPCIVILDEFDNLEQVGIKNPYVGFGKMIMVQKDTMYIVSSSRNAAIRKIISEKLSLLFGNFEVIKIGNFGAKASRKFLDSKLADFEIDGFARSFIFAFTDGNPFYLEKIASRAKELAIERMTSYIEKGVLCDAIIDTVYNSGGAIHQYLMNFILDILDSKNRDLHISIMTAIAGGINRQPDIARSIKVKKGEVSKAMSFLTEKALVTKSGTFYRVEDSMLEFWLKNVYQRRREILVDGTFDRMDLFRDDIRSYLSQYEKEFARDSTSRIAELFGAFSNELAVIGSKSLRLPRFTKVDLKPSEGSHSLIAASFRGSYWMARAYDDTVNENDIIAFIRDVKTLDLKVANKLIMPLRGIEENAKLLAKELRISIWDGQTLNALMGFYRKKRIVLI
jgi:hypothetical protein